MLFISPWFVLPLAALYSFFFFAPELIVFGALIDAYFRYDTLPEYVIGASLIVIIAELTKPYLSFYST